MNWLKRLLCAHRYEWMRNIYGDEINLSGGKRSLWGCVKCDKVQARDGLHDDGDLRCIAGPLPERGWDLMGPNVELTGASADAATKSDAVRASGSAAC